MRSDISAEQLREEILYEPLTGMFWWQKAKKGRRLGVPAGCRRKGDGYLVIGVDGVLYTASRLAWLYMTGCWPSGQVDHANQDTADNRWKNLRDASPSQNGANTRAKRNNKSGYKGVCWDGRKQLWLAQLSVNRRAVLRAWFDSAEDAHAAYVAAAEKHQGEFARAA